MPTFARELPGRRLLRSTAVGLVFALAAGRGAQGACVPAPTGSDDLIVCTGTVVGNVSAGGGNDRVTLSDAGEIQGNLTGGTGSDSLWVSDGTVTGSVGGGSGSDSLVIGSGSGAANIGTDVSAGDRDDLLYVGSGADVGGRLLGGSGDDTLIFAEGSVALDILGGAGGDQITLAGGSAASDVLGGSGDDAIVLSGSTVTGALYGGSGGDGIQVSGGVADGIYGGQGDDEVTLGGGSILTDIYGSSGSDGITLAGGLLGNDAYGGSGADDITLAGSSVTGDLFGGSGLDLFSIVSGTADEVRGSDGGDTIAMTGGTVQRLDGGDQDDTVTVTGGTVDGSITGASGSDSLFVGGSATVGDLDGGGDADLIVVSGSASVSGTLYGRDGSDTLRLLGGSIAGDFYGGDGDEQVTLDGSSVTGSLQGGSGDDLFTILSGAAEGALGGTGQDSIAMSGGTLARLSGGSGSDWIQLSDGSVTDSVAGGQGDDTLTIIGGTAGVVLGGSGNDTLFHGIGTLDSLAGGSGDDSLTVTGMVNFEVRGEQGDDVVRLGGLLQGDVYGGSGSDTLSLAAGSVGPGRAILGDSGSDSLYILGGSTERVFGGGGDDSFDLAGGTVSLEVAGDLGADVMTVSGTAAILGPVTGGGDSDSFFLNSAAAFTGIDGGDADDSVFVGAGFDGLLPGLITLAGGAGTGDLVAFSAVEAALADGFTGFEILRLEAGTTLDLHNGSDLRSIAGDAPVLLGIEAGSVLVARGHSPGFFSLAGSLGSDGTLEMRDGGADDLAVLAGDFGGGGLLGVDAALDASAQSDRLVVGGAVTTVTVPGMAAFAPGGTAVAVNDIGGPQGALTGSGPGQGIAVIDVSASGGTNPGDFFLLGGPIQKGAVQYDLVLESDGIWYLQSSLLAQVYGYGAAPSAALAMGQDYLGTLRQRVGTREQSWTGGATQFSDGTGVWLRGGGRSDQVADGAGHDYGQDHWFTQVGADLPLLVDPAGGRLIGGLFAHYGTSNVEAKDNQGSDASQIALDAWGGGLSLTWYGAPEGAAGEGPYVDLAGQVTAYGADFKSVRGSRGSTDGWGWGVSLETGWGFTVADQVRLIPQAQLTYSRISLDGFTDDAGVAVDYGSNDSLEGRVGLAVDSGKLWRSGNVTFTASLVHEFLGESEVTASGLDVGSDLAGTAAELGMAATVSLLDNVSLYGALDYRVPFDQGREGIKAEAGIRLSW